MAILRRLLGRLGRRARGDGGDGAWERCPACAEILPSAEVIRNHRVCPACGHHYPFGVADRMALLLDEGSFQELERELATTDLLRFKGARRYEDQLSAARKATGADESVRVGTARIQGRQVAVGFVDPAFLGGSLGCVAAERLCRLFHRAATERLPAVVVTAGGGLRAAEGVLGLSQVARLAEARARLAEARVPLLSVLVAPLRADAARAYALSGDVNLAEPSVAGAADAGADPLAQQGLVDRLVPRARLRAELARLMALLA